MLEIKNNENTSGARIVVIGVGGGGNNAVNRMADMNIMGVELIGVNTDMQVLKLCKAPKLIPIGEKKTSGLGSGGKPEVGQESAEESIDALTEAIQGAQMVFVTCGMGGGTGTGAAPVIAKIAKEKGILTVGIVTKPFHFEGKPRMGCAMDGIERLSQYVDTLIVIPNNKLLEVCDRRITVPDAMKKADEVLQQAVMSITDLINVPSDINLDFADVRSAMENKGIAHLGIGVGKGDNRALDAVKMAVESPMLETKIDSATDIIINISGDVSLFDTEEAMEYIQSLTGENVNVFYGSRYEEDAVDTCKISIIATGIQNAPVRPSGTGLPNAVKTTNPGGMRTVVPNGGAAPTAAEPDATPEAHTARPVAKVQPSAIRSNVEKEGFVIPSFLGKKD